MVFDKLRRFVAAFIGRVEREQRTINGFHPESAEILGYVRVSSEQERDRLFLL